MLKTTRGTVSAIIEYAEELDNVVHIRLNEVRNCIVYNALLMKEEPNFCSPRRLPLIRQFAVGQGSLHFFIRGKLLKDFDKKLSRTCAEMPRRIRVLRI